MMVSKARVFDPIRALTLEVLVPVDHVELDAQPFAASGLRPVQVRGTVDGWTDANCTFYPETGHRLCFGFRSCW